MNNYFKKHKAAILVTILSLASQSIWSQIQTKNALIFNSGVGFTTNYTSSGGGVSYGLGYQINLYKNRLRLCPNISSGTFTTKGITDISDDFFNSTNLKLNLNFDVVKYKSSSIFLGLGYTFNRVNGYEGIGGEFYLEPHYFTEYNSGVSGCIGYRLSHPEKRFGFELRLLDFVIEPSRDETFTDLQVINLGLLLKI
jgi:hypothetical protein